MTLWRIAWRSITHRGLASFLTAFSMALGVGLVVAVLVALGVLSQSFSSNADLGYNMVIGANKGGKLQIVLNTVFYISQPVENLKYEYYLEFLDADERERELQFIPPAERPAARGGAFGPLTQFAIPVCLGDFYREFRVVGTNSRFFDVLSATGEDDSPRYAFAQGRNFLDHGPEHGFYEAVVGARVARDAGLKLGDALSPSHGSPDGAEHHGTKFHVVGILAASGTPIDRAVFVNMEGFFLMEGHALDPEEDAAAAPDPAPQEGAPAGEAPPGRPRGLPIKQREVTAVLVRTVNPAVAQSMMYVINKGKDGQAVFPVKEIYDLLNLFVTPLQRLLLLVTAMVCVVSGISILVSIYNSMSERRHEIAVMRALGAGRGTVMTIVLLESVILSLGGGLGGFLGGHALVAALSPWIESRMGVSIGLFQLAPPVDVLEVFGSDSIMIGKVYPELLLIPALVLLAILVGLIPAMAAYRTDVARSLGGNP